MIVISLLVRDMTHTQYKVRGRVARCTNCTGRFVYSFMWLGVQTVSSLERSPLFSVLHREIPLYLYVIVIDLLVHDVMHTQYEAGGHVLCMRCITHYEVYDSYISHCHDSINALLAG